MDPSWYLRKYDDGGIFGPLPFDQLSRWASKARVAPRDLVSSDQETWMKAPMLSELGMDWLVEVTSERYYGPTTLGAINEFVRLGEVTRKILSSTRATDRAEKFRRSLHFSLTRLKRAMPWSNKRPRPRACRSSSRNGFAIWSGVWERNDGHCRKRKSATANWNNGIRNCWRLRLLNRSALFTN